MIKKTLTALLFLMIVSSPAFAGEKPYLKSLFHTWGRGLTNLVSAPLEIPLTVKEYHGQAGRPVFRHSAGFVDGTFQMIERFGSGAMDIFVAILPGMQEGIPVEPETLF